MVSESLIFGFQSQARTTEERTKACKVASAGPPRIASRRTQDDDLIRHIVSLSCAAVVLATPACGLASDTPFAGSGARNYVTEEVTDFAEELTDSEIKSANALLGQCFPVTVDLEQPSDPDLPLSDGRGAQPLRTPPPPQRLLRRVNIESSSNQSKSGESQTGKADGPGPSSPPPPHGQPDAPSLPRKGPCPTDPPNSPSEPPEVPPPSTEPFPAVPLPAAPDFPPIFLCDTWGEPGSTC